MIAERQRFSFSSADCILLAETTWLVGVVRVGLWLLPFSTLRRILRRSKRLVKTPKAGRGPSPNRIIRTIEAVSQRVPNATCLTQALAAVVLLNRYGYAANLRIGVAKTESRRLSAHAWVEVDGNVMIGEMADLARYTVLS